MIKKFTCKTINGVRFYALLICLSFSLVSVAQTTDSVTQALIDAKMARLANMNWSTPLGKINPNNTIMVTGPEQDCAGGIDVCAQTYTQLTSYTGHGTIQEVVGTCLLGGETNSAWYIFTAQTSGTFGFTLVTLKDYDFALYDISVIGCAGVPTAAPVRCNFSATVGTTGMTPAGVNPSEPAGGIRFSTELAIVAGQTYALIIDNWTADATGYTLNFTTGAGYASITDVTPPTINPPNSVINNCNGTFTLAFSEPVRCSSIATVAPFDFTLTGGGVITSVSGVGCGGATVLTNSVTINYTVPSSGTYTLGVQNGSDGNTILDKCNNAMLTTQTVTINALNALTLTPNVSTICTAGNPVQLTAAGAPSVGSYTLNPGGLTGAVAGGVYTFTVNPGATTTYVVTYNDASSGCMGSASTTITLVSGVIVSLTPVNPTLCAGSTTLTASTTINGVPCVGCTFSFNGGAYSATNTVTATPPVTYNVTTTTPGGCVGSNTATSTVSLASAGGGSNCNIYYVNSYNGAGDCLTKATPGGLLTALGLANCNNAIIYMQIGIYNFPDRVLVNSFVTIEGGFTNAFTVKTSDMSGGANSTTIRRNPTADSDNAAACSAFKVQPNATSFRFQDLRIEMPGNAGATVANLANSSGISNYAIKMGALCTAYNIVRCYIDAGKGANP